MQSITSFALYGFPESHAASFALLAYASAYLKCHYLAAFTAAMLNNQPMGFYQPATLVKDAQRHGLRVKPIDVTCSEWLCTLEREREGFSVRLGLRYVRGLRAEVGAEIVRERGAAGVCFDWGFEIARAGIAQGGAGDARGDWGFEFYWWGARRRIGGMRCGRSSGWRGMRDLCWRDARRRRRRRSLSRWRWCCPGVEKTNGNSPLLPMTAEERLVADFHGTGMTVGPHPMKYHRARMKRQGAATANELNRMPDGTYVRFAGGVIARQRPGTAHGFVFLSLEDETGIANAIITPQLFAEQHVAIVSQQFLWIEGRLQNQDHVVSVKVENVRGLVITEAETASHDFH